MQASIFNAVLYTVVIKVYKIGQLLRGTTSLYIVHVGMAIDRYHSLELTYGRSGRGGSAWQCIDMTPCICDLSFELWVYRMIRKSLGLPRGLGESLWARQNLKI